MAGPLGGAHDPLRSLARWVGVGMALVLFGACGPCGGSSSTSSGGNGCGHPGICLTVTGPLAGTTSGLVLAPDCIPGGGLDAVFTTNIAGKETSFEILVTDNSAKSSPGFHPGTFDIKSSRGTSSGTAFASIWVKPDKDVAGFPGGWSTETAGSSGSVTINQDQSGNVQSAVVAAARGSGAPLHVSGSFNCR